MKFIGGLILLGYLGLALSGWEPFESSEKGRLPGDVRRAPGGVLMWTSGFQGGK